MKLKSLSVFIFTVLLCGCAFLRESPSTAKLLVQYSVSKFAEQSSPDRRIDRLNNVKKVATGVKAVAANETTSIPLLRAVVMAQVAKLQLSPADTILATGLVDMI